MSEESDAMGGQWGLYGESRYGDVDPMAAMAEANLAMEQAEAENAGGYNISHKATRAIAALKPADLVRWVNMMVVDHNLEAFNFYMARAEKIFRTCSAHKAMEEEE